MRNHTALSRYDVYVAWHVSVWLWDVYKRLPEFFHLFLIYNDLIQQQHITQIQKRLHFRKILSPWEILCTAVKYIYYCAAQKRFTARKKNTCIPFYPAVNLSIGESFRTRRKSFTKKGFTPGRKPFPLEGSKRFHIIPKKVLLMFFFCHGLWLY